jgi:YHS domain-containing protein
MGAFTFIFIGACQPHAADLYVSSDPSLHSFDGDGPINRTREGIALKGYDVVAFFTEGKPVKGSEEIEATYEETTFRFSSKENHKHFLEDPEKYLPAYGGFCALGVANGYKDDMHPEAFAIVDGRLFFNLTPRIHQYWKIDPKRYIRQADENWPRLKTAPGYGPADGR